MDSSSDPEKCESIEENYTFNTSMVEYDVKVAELILKSDKRWTCKECPYSSEYTTHVKEHVERHIEGFSFDCDYCDKTFSMKRNLRAHKYSCKEQKLE